MKNLNHAQEFTENRVSATRGRALQFYVFTSRDGSRVVEDGFSRMIAFSYGAARFARIRNYVYGKISAKEIGDALKKQEKQVRIKGRGAVVAL